MKATALGRFRRSGAGKSFPGDVPASSVPVCWCFHCYAVNDHPAGLCGACGEPVEAPASLTWTGGLIWALRHPDGDRAVLAANALGRLRAREAVPALRGAAEDGSDIYLRAAALRSLIAIEGVQSLRPWLDELSTAAAFSVRVIARRALEEAAVNDAR
jgi:HEAT repeats